MRDPVETITTASAFVGSSSAVPGAQVVDSHEVIPDETPHEILLAHEIFVWNLKLRPPTLNNFSTSHHRFIPRKPRMMTLVYEHGARQEAYVDAKENCGVLECI